MEDTEQETNPYLALRAAKIARNQARLLELGLVTSLPDSSNRRGSSTSKRTSSVAVKLVNGSQSRKLFSPNDLRRSNRLSGQRVRPNYMDDPIQDRRPSRSRKRHLSEHRVNEGVDIEETETVTVSQIRLSLSSTSPPSRAPPSPNSVRSISLHGNLIVQNFLGKQMVEPGKHFVIHQSYRVAAHQEDKDRLGDDPALSFNKYSGVQEWKNVIFLWVNLVATKQNDGAVRTANQFLQSGKLVTWFGGSKMREDSSVIQSLIKMGKEGIETNPPTLVLWCRQSIMNDNRRSTSTMGPYVCLGRLAYDSYAPGSHPVAFTWRLVDYDMLSGPSVDSETRERFKGIVESTI